MAHAGNRSREELFEIWAPPSSIWRRWAIPVLLAQLPKHPDSDWYGRIEIPERREWVPPAPSPWFVVVDLAEATAVATGLMLARCRYRPVPLLNGCHGEHSVVDQEPLMMALCSGADWLASQAIDDAAPPAFLLDSRRMNGFQPVLPGMFDNRWKTFPQDFPAADFLLQQHLSHCLLVQDQLEIAEDLCHVLCRWQEAGIEIWCKQWRDNVPAVRVEVPRPTAYRQLWYRPAELQRLKHSLRGGFGGIVPEPRRG
jgi:hypothetical protein